MRGREIEEDGAIMSSMEKPATLLVQAKDGSREIEMDIKVN